MITIFTDGASKGNPGSGGWGAVIVFQEGENDGTFQVKELGGREKQTTNNQMELTAAIKSLEFLSKLKLTAPNSIVVYTDSSYLINGITKWVYGWQKNNWLTKEKKDVLNKKLWEKLVELSSGKKINWKYLGGHSGIAGNERCDGIATQFADGEKVSLYKGPIDKYKIDILNIDINLEKSNKKSKNKERSKVKAYSYLSIVDGEVIVHSNWAECEKRVKGKSGAKFKKSLNLEDERQIIKEWTNL